MTHHPRAYRADACRCDECRTAKADENATRERATPAFVPLRSERVPFASVPWMVDGLCREIGGDYWFPQDGESPRIAKRICRQCSVVVECLAFALTLDGVDGVWGGTTPTERRRMRRTA